MHPDNKPNTAIVRVMSTLAFGLIAFVSLPAAMAEGKPDPPQLIIAIDNGQASATDGHHTNYTITITNLAPKAVKDLVVTQSLPPGLQVDTIDTKGSKHKTEVRWDLDLKSAQKITLHTKMTVTKPPQELLRLATIACAKKSVTGPPIVCASDSDQLPAGAAADAERADLNPKSPNSRIVWYTGSGITLVIVATALLLLRRKRRGHRTKEGV